MVEDNTKLEVPANVKTRLEFINGIGIKECIITFISLIISSTIGMFFKLITDNFFGMLIIIFILTGGTFIFIMKDKNRQSVAEMIKNIIKFSKKQKKYKFRVNEVIKYER